MPSARFRPVSMFREMLRHKWFNFASFNYPLYDCPHKNEDRLLTSAQAQENLQYLLDVRAFRVAQLRAWLKTYFFLDVSPDELGVWKIGAWISNYGQFLLPDRQERIAFRSYQPVWIGSYRTCNIAFDLGIAFGEFTIRACPKLHWDCDAIPKHSPNLAKQMQQTSYSSLQRPIIVGFEVEDWYFNPLGDIESLIREVCERRSYSMPDMVARRQRPISEKLLARYRNRVREYSVDNPRSLYNSEKYPLDKENEWRDD